jgi:hypothetical protein
MAIFSGAAIAVAVMAGSLELGKLVTASWLYRNWKETGWLLKSYLTVAVVVLMFITSLGIFGYLSKAHSDQSVISGGAVEQVALFDEKIKYQREVIDTNQKVIAQIYNTSEPTNLADSKTVQLTLNSYGRNSELLRATNQALGLPDKFECQLEHPYEITACLITEIIVNRNFYNENKNNKYIKSCVEWINRNFMQ